MVVGSEPSRIRQLYAGGVCERSPISSLSVNSSIHTRFFALGINFYISQYAQFFPYSPKQFTDLLAPIWGEEGRYHTHDKSFVRTTSSCHFLRKTQRISIEHIFSFDALIIVAGYQLHILCDHPRAREDSLTPTLVHNRKQTS